MGYAYLYDGDIVNAEKAFLQSMDEFAKIADEAHSFWSILGLARITLRQGKVKSTREFLNKASDILEGRQDSSDETHWWLISGRLSLLQGDLEKARLAFGRALEYSQQADNMDLLRTVVEFAYLYQRQSEPKKAARLLGFVQSQAGLPAWLVQGRIQPLLASLATQMDEQELSLLLTEGVQLDRQAVIKELT